MLIEATFENILSFDKPTTFSMVAGKITKQHTDHVRKIGGMPVLRGAILYGANAAGKSNVLKALLLFKNMLLSNDCSSLAGQNFLLTDTPYPNMSFDLVFCWGQRVFRYRVTTDGSTIKEETLWMRTDGGDERLFARVGTNVIREIPLADDWYRSRTFQGQSLYLMKMVSDGLSEFRATIPNAELILSAVQSLQLVFPFSLVIPIANVPRLLPGGAESFKAFLEGLLQEADAGISEVVAAPLSKKALESMPLAAMLAKPDSSLLIEQTQEIAYCFTFGSSYVLLSRTKSGLKGEELKLRHGRAVFPLSVESEGTIRLLEYAPFLFFLRSIPATYLVDEFDSHLHPVLSKFLLRTIFDHSHPDAQFIVTAHDMTLMTHDLWRTDEIWFAEKRLNGSTDLYSMYNFTPRFDKNLEKGYRQGLYGAVPFPGGGLRQ